MAITWPAKNNYATGDVLTATNMNGIGDDLNALFDNSFYAGKNKIINGDFGIWQRGTSFNNLNGYGADRWTTIPNAIPTSMTTSQQTFTAGTAPVAGYEGTYYLRNTITTAGSMTNLDLAQKIEDVRTFAGQTVTLSFWAKADSARSSIIYLAQDFGSGGSATVYSSGPTLSLTTSWTRFSFTLSLASISGKTIGTGNNLTVGIRQAIANGSVLDIWGVQLEAGSTATPFQTATGTKQGELAACQRYYQRFNSSAAYAFVGQGWSTSTTTAYCIFPLPTTMRTSPSSIDYSSWALHYIPNDSYNSTGTWSLNTSNPSSIGLTYTHGSAVFSTSNLVNSSNGANSSAYIGFNAEL